MTSSVLLLNEGRVWLTAGVCKGLCCKCPLLTLEPGTGCLFSKPLVEIRMDIHLRFRLLKRVRRTRL